MSRGIICKNRKHGSSSISGQLHSSSSAKLNATHSPALDCLTTVATLVNVATGEVLVLVADPETPSVLTIPVVPTSLESNVIVVR
jgi:hypothetical protein